MPKLPVLSGQEVVKLLCVLGFTQVSQKGSHVKLKGLRHGINRTVIVPLHNELALGTLGSILKQAGVDIEELTSQK